MVHTSSQILVKRALEQDASAVGELYDRYRERLRQALRRRLGDQYRRVALLDSEDAVQDAILAAMNGLHRFEYRGSGSFLAWVLRIAESQILQRLRNQRAEKRDANRKVALEEAAEPMLAAGSPSQMAQANETETRIQRCLEQLEQKEREVIVLRRYMDFSADEIREEMDLVSSGAARALLSRAQARLAALLDGDAR